MNPRDFLGFALRDSLVVLAALSAWLIGPLDVLWWHVTAGVLTGLSALLLHEWGHLYGAFRGGATVRAAPLWSPFLFNLSSTANSREQFLSASLWGFYASGVFIVLFVLFLPTELLAGRIAMIIALTLATLTVVIEFPIAWRVHKGYPIPRVEIFRD